MIKFVSWFDITIVVKNVHYWCGLIRMIVTPVFVSPFIMAWTTGAAPLHLGNILPWMFNIPLWKILESLLTELQHIPNKPVFTYNGKLLMIRDGMRCPNEATTPKSKQSVCEWLISFGSGQTEIGRLCCFAYFATKQGWGFGAGTTTDNSLTIFPFCLYR